MKVDFHEIIPERNLLYVVIVTRYKNKWVFVRQKGKDTWEIPGGHIEQNEPADDAARRELAEETGAKKFDIKPICDFSVQDTDGKLNYSRLYYAEVYEFGELGDYEIEEIMLCDKLPDKLTHPTIQPMLFEKGKHEVCL